jgi:hypothetical protein
MPFAIYAEITSTMEFLIGPIGFFGAGAWVVRWGTSLAPGATELAKLHS